MAAAKRLAWLLADRGDLNGLRTLADTGDRAAAEQVAWVLADRGDLDGLRTLAVTTGLNAGPVKVTQYPAPKELTDLLVSLLIKQDRREEAERLLRSGLNPDGSTA